MFVRRLFNKLRINKEEIEYNFFLIGIFFLASAPSLAIIFLIFPIFNGMKKNFRYILKDKLNFFLLGSSLIMIFKSLLTSFLGFNQIENWDPELNWIGLSNWIPLFIVFLGTKIYVKNSRQKEIFGKVLILGTVPVIFSCLSQYFLKWYGPYELFNGFIVWFQRPIREINQPVTGLFSNPNYTGAWLSIIFPFLLFYLQKKRSELSKFKTFMVFIFVISQVLSISLINSRAAWLSTLITLPLIFGRRVLFWLLPFLLIIIFMIYACIIPIFPMDFNNIICFLVPDNILSNFNNLPINDGLTRFSIWNEAINYIAEKPLFGWGAASFPMIYRSQMGIWMGHPHNLFLELAFSYGLIVAITIFTFFGIIITKNFESIYILKKNKNIFEKAWFTASIVFFILHLFDIVYFDLRISILFWILIAGLSNNLDQTKKYKLIKNA